jgi:hypothetical protein
VLSPLPAARAPTIKPITVPAPFPPTPPTPPRAMAVDQGLGVRRCAFV